MPVSLRGDCCAWLTLPPSVGPTVLKGKGAKLDGTEDGSSDGTGRSEGELPVEGTGPVMGVAVGKRGEGVGESMAGSRGMMGSEPFDGISGGGKVVDSLKDWLAVSLIEGAVSLIGGAVSLIEGAVSLAEGAVSLRSAGVVDGSVALAADGAGVAA